MWIFVTHVPPCLYALVGEIKLIGWLIDWFKLLDRQVNGVYFLTGGVFECSITSSICDSIKYTVYVQV